MTESALPRLPGYRSRRTKLLLFYTLTTLGFMVVMGLITYLAIQRSHDPDSNQIKIDTAEAKVQECIDNGGVPSFISVDTVIIRFVGCSMVAP